MKETDKLNQISGAGKTVRREPDEVYEQAKQLAAEDTEESLEKAMYLFQSIKGYRDAGRQYYSCRTRLGRMKWLRKSAIIKGYEDRHEKQLGRRKKIGLTVLVVVLLCLAVISTAALVKYHRYSKAGAYFTAGEYKRSADAFMQMADYKDSATRVYLSAVELYNLKRYEEALPYFIWLDGRFDKGYYLRKCTEKLGAEP